jgi:hypothetical protein
MMYPFVGGPFQRFTVSATSASLASRHSPRALPGSQPPSPPEDVRPAAPEDGVSPFADLPDPTDPL